MKNLQAIAERIVENDQVLHHALVSERLGAACDLHVCRLELRRQRLERARVSHLPAEHIDALAAISVNDDALLAVVHAERNGRGTPVDPLQAKKPGSIARPVAKIPGAGANVTESFNTHWKFLFGDRRL